MDAKTIDARTHEFDVQDVEYLRHGDKPLLARVYKPRGEGPFPAVVDLQGAYPKALADINYAIRWVKAHAKELKTRPDLVGISGQSSGGHLAMLAAMRPHDPRYTAIALPAGSPAVDATVKCVIMSWPVINPLGRYRFAKRQNENKAEWAPDIISRHDQFWVSEDNMAEANPMLILERGEKAVLPPAIWHQGRGDMMHDYKDEEFKGTETEAPRFAANYKKAGGQIELCYFDGDRKPGHGADLTKIGDTFERMLGFVGKHLK
jgi:acetyl esterase/lipase